MSDVVHHSTAPTGVIPKRFLCGRKCKQSSWTRVADFVDCPQCRAKLREQKAQADKSSAAQHEQRKEK